jgi:HSP20 family molecular chaperone IbpA
LNDYYFSTIPLSKSFLPYQSRTGTYLSNGLIPNSLQERVPIKYGSSPISLGDRQLNQEQKAKSFLSSSSSRFISPTITPRTYYDRSSSFIREQQKFSYPYRYEQKHTPKTSFLSSNFSNYNSLTSRFIRPSTSFECNNNIFDNSNDCQLDNMSSLRYSYDQRISDQGNKYIIQLKTDDYQENDFIITPRYYQNQLIIDAKHNEEDSLGGFIRRELHKIFLIPKHIDLNKYTYSYNKNTQELTIEMPYLQSNINEIKQPDSLQNTNQSLTFSYDDINLTNGGHMFSTLHPIANNTNNDASGLGTTINDSILTTNEPSVANKKPFDFDLFHQSAFRPQIIQTPTNGNKLLMSLDLSDYLPEDIKISIKDQELIVKAERKIQTDTKKSRTSFFQSTTLPPSTDIEHLQSNYIDGKLIIEAPYLERGNKTNE